MGRAFWGLIVAEEVRIPVLAIVTIATVLTAAPTRAQTYNPDYPVCLHAFAEKAGYIECASTSLPQCNGSASCRAAPAACKSNFASGQWHGEAHRIRAA